MELQQVRYFVALCRTLNFTRAAEACDVSQSALTRAIQKLEEELGGPLFQRERNLTQLTELGRLMRPLLEQTLATADAAKASADRFQRSELASLRLGFAASIAADVATPALGEVLRRIPSLHVELAVADHAAIVARLLDGDADAAFLGEEGELGERLTRWRLYREAYVLAMPSAHPLAALDPVPVAALAGHMLIERRGSPAAATLAAICAERGVALGTRHVADSEEQMQHLAAASLGPALLPERTARLPALLARRIADVDLGRTVVLAVVNGRRFSPALDAFIRLVRARDYAGDGSA
jgi:DNA-binding transcriptional LysR family regulator